MAKGQNGGVTHCIVCARNTKSARCISLGSKAGERKRLQERILHYGEVTVIDGLVCRNCDRRLNTLDRMVAEFRQKCQKQDAMRVRLAKKSAGKAKNTEKLPDKSSSTDVNQQHTTEKVHSYCLRRKDDSWLTHLQTSVHLTTELHTTFTACATQVSTADSKLLVGLLSSLVQLLDRISAIAGLYRLPKALVVEKQETSTVVLDSATAPDQSGVVASEGDAQIKLSDKEPCLVPNESEISVKNGNLSERDIFSGQPLESEDDNDMSFDPNGEANSATEPSLGEVKCQENQKFDILVQDIDNDKKPRYKCWTCGKQFESLRLLKRHFNGMKTEHKCETCGKEFRVRNLLLRHKVAHSNIRPYKCDTCGMAFKRKDALQDHQQTHSERRPLPCDICGKVFSTRKTLVDHEIKFHSNVRAFACEFCGKTFARMNHLNRHRKMHSTEKPYMCETCGKVFKYHYLFKSHVSRCELKHFCEVCGKGFEKEDDLNEHCYVHKVYKCDVCGEIFKGPAILEQHQLSHSDTSTMKLFPSGEMARVEVVHDNTGSFITCTSGRSIQKEVSHNDASTTKLGSHEEFVNEEAQTNSTSLSDVMLYKCGICGHMTLDKSEADNHMTMHLPQNTYSHNDNSTVEPNTSGTTIKEDIFHDTSTITPSGNVVGETVSCNDASTTRHDSHEESVKEEGQANSTSHPAKILYRCGICGHMTLNKSEAVNHMTMHLPQNSHDDTSTVEPNSPGTTLELEVPHNSSPTTPSGKVVGETVSYNGASTSQPTTSGEVITEGIQPHKPSSYPPPKTLYKCGICDKVFVCYSKLECHIRTHSDVKLFKCEVCDKTFKRMNDKKRHLTIHSGIKPHQCSYCDKAFRLKKVLIKHERTHTGERPYVCETCGFAFTVEYTLREHQNLHTGAKPYSCETCGKRFSHGSKLRSHRRVHLKK